jgi:hypothetical protein
MRSIVPRPTAREPAQRVLRYSALTPLTSVSSPHLSFENYFEAILSANLEHHFADLVTKTTCIVPIQRCPLKKQCELWWN